MHIIIQFCPNISRPVKLSCKYYVVLLKSFSNGYVTNLFQWWIRFFTLLYHTGIGNSPIVPFMLLHKHHSNNFIKHIQITNSIKKIRKNSFDMHSVKCISLPNFLVLFDVTVMGYSVNKGTKWFQKIILSAS